MAPETEIRIGVFASLTGPDASFGLSTKSGIDLATRELNTRGGIKGKKVRLIIFDNRGLDEKAEEQTKELITKEKVHALIGDAASSRSLKAAPIAQKFGIPMVTPSATNPEVTQVGDFIFRACFIDSFQGWVMAQFAYKQLNIKNLAVFRDQKSKYSQGLASAFVEEFTKLGGRILNDIGYKANDVDFTKGLKEIKKKTPEAIYIPGYYGDVATIAIQARQMGVTVPLLGGDGWDSPHLFDVAGDYLEPAYVSNHFVAEEFKKHFAGVYAHRPDALAALAYDGINLLFQAIEKSPKLKPKEIRDQLKKIKNFKGVTGKITLNEERNASKPAVILKVENKQFSFVTKMNPVP